MWLVITFCIGFLISNVCLAAVNKDFNEKCHFLGEKCQDNSDCCSDFICRSDQGNICSSSRPHQRSKRNIDDSIIPPYYNPKNQLYPYGISKPILPFYKGLGLKTTDESKKMEWDHCQFHEECGEGNCCYVHFRFRSLPKWFCRPNRNELTGLCEPLTKYRSLKDVSAWKQLQEQQEQEQEQEQ
ncbi:unnamed protein product [Adineta ricciae]|uniref:Uncharacterized protein n=1 Tax=Adineta ricciae TaxID=249248 RepID=A0A813XB05_ADIRI|nr:unnamed protein product [Adineta ricciae]